MTDDATELEAPDDHLGLEDHPLTALRLEKHRAMLATKAYPYRYARTATALDIRDAHGELDPGTDTDVAVAVAGRVVLMRSFGKLMFVTLRDGTGQIQLFVDQRSIGEDGFATFADFDLGDWIGAGGTVMTTKKGELSVRVTEATLLQKSLRPLPDKYHGLQDVELRSRRRYIDLIANDESRSIALARASIVSELRRQFEARGYIEVETPVLLNQATGALARPFETHHHALDQHMYLRIATELFLKRLIVGGLEKVFEIGRIFRNEGIDSTHNPEFTMLESYEAYADYRDIMVMVEEMLSSIATTVTGSTTVMFDGAEVNLAAPFRRARMIDLVSEAVGREVTFDMTIDDLAGIAREHGVEVDSGWGHGKYIDTLFEALVADGLWEPTYVLDHPKEVSPLARENRDDPNLTERFELFIAGAEYANAFSELNDPIDQRERFEAQARAKAAGDEEAHGIDEDYLLALEYGMPPTGGLGIGVDRLVMLLTGQRNIREVILFPTMRPEA